MSLIIRKALKNSGTLSFYTFLEPTIDKPRLNARII